MRFHRPTFFTRWREFFGPLNQRQVDGATALLDAMEADPALEDVREAAYDLATCWHETAATLQPIDERGGDAYFDSLYDSIRASTAARRARARAMGNTAPGDGRRFHGRGYVQLTWQANYQRVGTYLGLDLVAFPHRALEPAIAYHILATGLRGGWFTGQKLSTFLTADRTDYVGARRTVNGQDQAVLIAGYAVNAERALSLSYLRSPS